MRTDDLPQTARYLKETYGVSIQLERGRTGIPDVEGFGAGAASRLTADIRT